MKRMYIELKYQNLKIMKNKYILGGNIKWDYMEI